MTRPTRAVLAATAGLLLILAASTNAESAMLVYKAKHRSAEELLPLVRTVLGEEGSAEVDARTNSLVLLGSPHAIGRVRALLSQQDRRPRSVILHYEAQSLSDLSARGYRVSWAVTGDSFRMGNVLPPTAGIPRSSTVDARAGSVQGNRRESFTGTLRVLDGTSGRIATGSTFPVSTQYGPSVSTTMVSAVSGFEAHAVILGDGRVQLELDPFQDRVESGGVIAHTGASTTLVVTPGQTVVVGGLGQSVSGGESSAVARRIEGASASDRVLVIRVEVE